MKPKKLPEKSVKAGCKSHASGSSLLTLAASWLDFILAKRSLPSLERKFDEQTGREGSGFRGGWLAIVFIFCKNRAFVITILWIFAWTGFVGIVKWLLGLKEKKSNNQSRSKSDPRFNTPGKSSAMLFNYGVSNLLFYLNPLLVTQMFLQIAGMIWEKAFGRPVLDAKEYQQKVNYILPVTGEWRVFNGGITKETSHSWDIPSQRFAYDLVKYGQNDRSFESDGRKLEDYFLL